MNSRHNYRAFLIGPDGHIIDSVELECENDEAAKERCKLLMDGYDIELWDGPRMVAEFKISEPNR